MTVAQELEQAERVIEEIEDLDVVKDAIEGSGDLDEALQRLSRLRGRRLAEWQVRVSVAAELLGLSVPTMNKWADLGLLEATNDGVRRVALRGVLEIRPFVQELRQLGKTRHLLQAVVDRIDDTETLTSPALRQSVEQMRRGELIDIAPQD